MHVGMLTACYTPVVNGVTQMVAQYDRHLTAAGHQVTIFTLGKPSPGEKSSKVVRSPAVPLGKTGYGFALGYNREAQRRLQQVDVLHCHHLLMGLEFARRYGPRPVVFTNHTRYDIYLSAYARLPYRLADLIMRFAWRQVTNYADCVIAPSISTRRILRKAGVRAPIELIENGVDITQFRHPSGCYAKTDLGIPEQAKLLTYIGRLSREKNVRRLIDEFQIAAATSEELHLLLVGKGPQRDQLARQVAVAGMADRVHFAGQVSPESVPELLAISDIFVTASLSEVHPLTVIEAQVAGLPVIAINSPGISEIVIHKQTGLLAGESRGSLADAMQQVSLQAAERRQMGARARVIGSRYDIRLTVERTLRLYQKLLDRVGGEGIFETATSSSISSRRLATSHSRREEPHRVSNAPLEITYER